MKIQVFSLLTSQLSMSTVNSPQSALFDDLRMRLKNQLSFYRTALYVYQHHAINQLIITVLHMHCTDSTFCF